MSYTSSINTILNNSTELKAKFPSIKLMILPNENDANYISFSKIKSVCTNTLDNYLKEEATYNINCYASNFDDLEIAESILVELLNGKKCGDGGVMSIISIEEEEVFDIKKYLKRFVVEIK